MKLLMIAKKNQIVTFTCDFCYSINSTSLNLNLKWTIRQPMNFFCFVNLTEFFYLTNFYSTLRNQLIRFYLVACFNISFPRLNQRVIEVKKNCSDFWGESNLISTVKLRWSHEDVSLHFLVMHLKQLPTLMS